MKTFKEFLEEMVNNQDISQWTKKITKDLDADSTRKEILSILKQKGCPDDVAAKVADNLGRNK